MTAANRDGGAVLYVTSQTPFGSGEAWAMREMLALTTAGCRLLVVPRTAAGALVHGGAEALMPRTIAVPLLSGKVIASVARACVSRPRQLAQAVSWTRHKSSYFREFIKGLAVLPKSIYLTDFLKSVRLRHIHAHSTTTVVNVAAFIASSLGCPFSFTLHTSMTVTPAYEESFRTLLAEAQFVRVISQEVGEKLLRLVGQGYAAKIKVIPLGVDCNVEVCAESSCSRPFRVLTPAVLLPHKGHRIALAACRMLLDRGFRDFRWTFCGDGPLRAEIEASITKLGLSGIVEISGMLPNDLILERYRMRQTDAVVLPSVATDGQLEGIPFALMEAMSYGVPVVSTDSGGTLELIGGGAGLVEPQGDAGALAAHIEMLMRNEDLRRYQGELGRSKVKTSFNAATTVEALLEAFGGGDQRPSQHGGLA